MRIKTALLLCILIVSLSCTEQNKPISEENSMKEIPLSDKYITEIEDWKTKRDVQLRAENGYVNLVGLDWLQEGVNTFGSDSSNMVVFPESAPKFMGTFTLIDSVVTVKTIDGIDITIDSKIANNVRIESFANKPVMEYKSFRWFIIERAGNIGVRLRDLDFNATKQPLNTPYYNLSKDWKITATFKSFDEPKQYKIDNILGHSFEEDIKGELVFEKDGKSYILLPLMSDDGMFIMFADGTSGIDTYGAGRYLSADLPNEKGEVLLDFNKAVNPPCAFTDYATCPLPMQENILELRIEAGEKYNGH